MSTTRGLGLLHAPGGILATSAAAEAVTIASAEPTAGPGFADLIGAALARLLAPPLQDGPLPEVGPEPGPPGILRGANRRPGGTECRQECGHPAPERRDGLASVPDAGSAGPNLAALSLLTQASPPALLNITPAPAGALLAQPTTPVLSGTVAARPVASCTAAWPGSLGTAAPIAAPIHEPGGSWAPADHFDPAAPGRHAAPGGDPEAPPADDRTPVTRDLERPAPARPHDGPPSHALSADVGVPAASAAPGDAREAMTSPSDPVSQAAIGAGGHERLRPAMPAGEAPDATWLARAAAAPPWTPTTAPAASGPHDLLVPGALAEAWRARPGDPLLGLPALSDRTLAPTTDSRPGLATADGQPVAPGEPDPSAASGSRAAGEHEPLAEPRAPEVTFRPSSARPVEGWHEPRPPREPVERVLTAHANGPVRSAPFETGAPLHTVATPAPVHSAGTEPSTAADLQAATRTDGSGRSAGSVAPGPGAPTAAYVAEHVLRAVLTLERPGRHRLELHLDPPDLGTVRVDAVVEGRRLVLALHAEREPARLALESALGRLTEALTQQGLVPERITVSGGLGFSGGPGDDRASRRDPTAAPRQGPRHEPAAVAVSAPEGHLDLRV